MCHYMVSTDLIHPKLFQTVMNIGHFFSEICLFQLTIEYMYYNKKYAS